MKTYITEDAVKMFLERDEGIPKGYRLMMSEQFGRAIYWLEDDDV